MTQNPKTNIRILLVEDEESNQFGTKSILEFSGYKVNVASNGLEALDLLEKNEFALVLMDCSMPIMDGYTAAGIIRDPASKILNHSIPIIALTAHSMQEDRNKCLAAGMSDYLNKPILIPDLITKVEKWTTT